MSTLASVILRDVAANRPAAGIAGRLFVATDTWEISRDNGATWDSIVQPLLRTTSAADPALTNVPTAGNAAIHKNTTTGNVFLAYNDGGTVRKVQLA